MSTVALVRCENYEYTNVKAAVAKGIDLLGGISSFVASGERILLKPNWIMAVPPERAATTHPTIFRAVCEILGETGVEITYGDSPGHGTTEDEVYEAAAVTGFLDVAESLGIQLADFING